MPALTEEQAKAFIEKLVQEALPGTGQRYELYAERFSKAVWEAITRADPGDMEVLIKAAKEYGDYFEEGIETVRFDIDE